MQALVVMALLILFGFFSYVESYRNDIASRGKLMEIYTNDEASNMIQYSDLLSQYVQNNYENLHDSDELELNQIHHVTAIDYKTANISAYSQKDLSLFFDYHSVVFNYLAAADQQSQFATLYLLISFNNWSEQQAMHHAPLDLSMGAFARLLAAHVYQGDSTSWVIPVLLRQDGKCNVNEIYSQTPLSSAGIKQQQLVTNLFGKFCKELLSQGQIVEKYVYLAPILPGSD